MRDTWLKLVLGALLLVIIGVPLAFRQREDAAPGAGGAAGARLVIVSPHNEQIRFEFAHGFNQWRAAQGQPAVEFDWRSAGGTSDLRRVMLDQFAAAARDGREDGGIGCDLFFGGGDHEHDHMAAGIQVKRGGKLVSIAVTDPIVLDDALFAAAFPQPTIGGQHLYHNDRAWVGTALSSFGIVYNRDVLTALQLPEPNTWSDLTDARYRRWIGLADPAHSGSIKATYDAILRRLGWKRGWGVLRRAFANARYFADFSNKVPVDVSQGDAAAGMCIDFYGRFQAGAVRGGKATDNTNSAAPGRVGYVDPPYMTAITADPITLLRGAPDKATAVQFITFVLLPAGQRLWQRRLGEPGGPVKFELRRLPVRRDMYTPDEQAHWSDPHVDPFGIARPFAPGMPSFFGVVDTVAHAMAIDVHDELADAWSAIADHPNHPRHADMLALFDRMPDDLTLRWPDDELAANWPAILADPKHRRHAEAAKRLHDLVTPFTDRWNNSKDDRTTDRLRWTLFFRQNYQRIVDMAASGK